ncbi:single-stranded DNA-binding protein [Nocardia asteroides]|uniref:single-stranded DNA-binding protein n=1 Tax=Nocardia asteroides TaxID=1824 RepID=UPI00343C8426
MAGETSIPLVGNLCSEIELRYTPAGAAVAHFTIASTPRHFDRNLGQWRDGEALFLRCNLWREPAENAAATLTKGTRVLALGRLKQRSFHTHDGDKRTVIEVDVDEIGPSLRWATAQLTRNTGQTRDGGFAQPETTTRTIHASTDTVAATGTADPWANDTSDAPARHQPQETSVLAGAAAGVGEPPF